LRLGPKRKEDGKGLTRKEDGMDAGLVLMMIGIAMLALVFVIAR
jgi:hypothetical protein